MSAIVPPLDLIPKLPAKGVNKFATVFDKQIDRLVDQVMKVVQDSTKLPPNLKCNDPSIKQIKDQIAQIQKQIVTIQQLVPKIQTTVSTVKSLIAVAQGIKLTLTVAQLSNPITAPVFIASQLMLIQDAVLVNAITSLKSLSAIPATLPGKLAPLIPQLVAAAKIVGNACGNEEPPLDIPTISDNGDSSDGSGDSGNNGYDGYDGLGDSSNNSNNGYDGLGDSSNNSNNGYDGLGDRIDGIDDVAGYGDALKTEFYTKVNVSEEDLDFRSDTIEQLLSQQRDLLTSILEAPSKVHQTTAAPIGSLGKLGDYVVDNANKNMYGPKLENDSWGQPVKF